ncbi:sex peptide receptor-related protein 2-like [Mya arenaria]|uniref:sex peptide receptor-related protein 2-like n=1 Tax=Mya arenaria TaxID=6604 RepID=UPI0022E4DAD0|nr:sex peptide receptor-related protein 2-like [Mya arenaria]XP_052759626.1 sex peptide receptor-related protein 2-like [Mya arenaria]XP_052759628.1 sex peptide receptor-related protein 2-like [Mya arenaria]XP_052759629.1 sex peptide receptor-related protein 2-like [Mya arenaria]XP_052760514.1 sex peptide receptor-related protein 2-like [Mya arenaria]XP_052760515.1 sex peptide receptor-related protein 2-like [Mya arenaria]XP_052760516.1 sex peptide receptor-related protein 2-like [Mya arenari
MASYDAYGDYHGNYTDHSYTNGANNTDQETHTHSQYDDYHYSYDDYNLYSFDDYDMLYDDHIYEIFDFEIVIYGYLWPILVIFTACCNLLVIGGFLRKRMRNPTNLILVFIAISDSLTGIVTLPATFYVFSGKHIFLSKDWCNVTMVTRLYISRAFHTISIWQTVLLAVHRFLQIRHPNLASRLCTTKKTLAAVGIMYLVSFLLHMFHAFDIKTNGGFCQWELRKPCGWACVYIWASLILNHVLPCVILVVLAYKMWKSLRKLNVNVSNKTVREKKERARKITLVVVLILVIFLVPELPYGIYFLITMILKLVKGKILPLKTNRAVHTAYEVLLVLSFHLNFWVYCAMYRSFRKSLKTICRKLQCQPEPPFHSEENMTSSINKDYELVGMTSDTQQENI